MKYGVLFAIVATLLVASAVLHGGWRWLLLWPAISFGIVAAGYLHVGPAVFGKSSRGVLSPAAHLLLLPYLVPVWLLWYTLRLVKREPAYHKLTEGVLIGRRLLSHEYPNNINHVIDLTCEFNEPIVLRSAAYHAFPILDGSVPAVDQLGDWARAVAKMSGNIYIHCAEGRGRTGLFSAALLLENGHSKSPDDAL
ncbi:phosphatase domain-containing putative toxin [Planctopirus hydrillae]|uniref:phosphatase domain-containing putative toxin n=1 Tax=Planctopirus hydrillae TaxID=1841610 RepID=UPI0009F3B924|nr:hypothetical protein [Planctopirus hydrillae]